VKQWTGDTAGPFSKEPGEMSFIYGLRRHRALSIPVHV
jgi:hypothetical protein